MRAKSIEKVFYHSGTKLTLSEAKEQSLLFLTYIKLTDEDLSDYWFGIADNWDLNIWMPNEETEEISMTLYRVEDGVTDTCSPLTFYP